MPLSAVEAARADDILERTIAAACLQVTVDGGSLDDALARHFAYLLLGWPKVHALVAARLSETNNPILNLMMGGGCDD